MVSLHSIPLYPHKYCIAFYLITKPGFYNNITIIINIIWCSPMVQWWCYVMLCQCNHSATSVSPFFLVPCHPSPVTPQPSTAALFEVATVASLGAVAVSFTHVVKAAVCVFLQIKWWDSIGKCENYWKSWEKWKNMEELLENILFVSICVHFNGGKLRKTWLTCGWNGFSPQFSDASTNVHG
jgi:hypothetical protein